MVFIGAVRNLRPEEFAQHAEEERAVFVELKNEGVIREAFRRTDGAGLFGVLEAGSLDELRQHLDRLPLTRHGLVEWTLTEVSAF